MTRRQPQSIFRITCLCGLFASLVIWKLPMSIKPYHVNRTLDNWTKYFVVEQISEWGFDSDGLVKVRVSHQFDCKKNPAAIAGIVRDWRDTGVRSPARWPTDSRRLHYDEWGPSNWTDSAGAHEALYGSVWCVPYSVIAIVCALPLAWLMVKPLLTKLKKIHHGAAEDTERKR